MLMNNEKNVQAMQLPVNKLRPFEGHPFQVKDDAEMEQLVWSILTQGLLTPITARPLENHEYEVISGHRRLHACKKAGIETVPALIYTLDRDAATIAMVDSNLHREKILPSEKAFAYKLKMDAMSRQGQRTDLTSTQVGRKLETAELIGQQSGDSKNQVRRYIRLTELSPELQQMVDEKKIAMTPAVEISYLKPEEQKLLVETIESEQATPSLSQAKRMKQMSREGTLTDDTMLSVMSEQKKPEKNEIVLPYDALAKFFPKNYTPHQMERMIYKLLENWQKKKQRQHGER